jgi:hypothetical protein
MMMKGVLLRPAHLQFQEHITELGSNLLDLITNFLTFNDLDILQCSGTLYQKTFYPAAAIVTLLVGILLWSSDMILQLAGGAHAALMCILNTLNLR